MSDELKPGDRLTLTGRNGDSTEAIVTDAGGCAIPRPMKPVPMMGRMPHDTLAARRDVVISRASSRRELSRILVEEIIPELQRLGGNDQVTQNVCKGILAALDAIKTQMEADAKRLMVLEDKLGITREG